MENLVNYLRQTSSNDSVNKTTTRSSVVHSCRKYAYVGFSRRKIPRSRRVARWQHRQGRLQSSVACTISEKAIQFRHLDYDPDRTQKLTSRPCRDICRHATFHPNPWRRFWVILPTDRRTDKRAQTHLPTPLSEVICRSVCHIKQNVRGCNRSLGLHVYCIFWPE